MSGLLNKKEWKEAAAQMLRQIQASKLDIKSLFPANEHLTGKSSPPASIRDNLQRFFAKSVDSLVQIGPLGDLLKQTPTEVVRENDKTHRELKNLQQEILYELMQAKGFLDSKQNSYTRTKAILSKLFGCGVGFPEADKLKAMMDDNRALEVELSKKYMTLDQLDEAEARLKKDKTNIDPAFAQIISEKRTKFEKLNNQLMQLLSKNSLRCEELKRICDIIDQAEHIRFRLSHFTNVCHIRDSFHWTIILDQFLDGGDHSRERFRQLTDRIKHADTSRALDFDTLRTKIIRFTENLAKTGDIEFFKVLLEPVSSIDSTDQNIQTIIDYLKSTWWALLAKKKLDSQSITIEELEELYKTSPPGNRANQDPTHQKVRELYQQYKLKDGQLVILLKELRECLAAVDEESILTAEMQSLIATFNERFEEVQNVYDTKLSIVSSLKSSERFTSCLGLTATLNCASSLSKGEPVDPQQLDLVDHIFGSEDEAKFSSVDLVARVFAGLNDKKIVSEFLNIVDQQPDNVSLDEKIDINTAKKYIEIMKAERQIIDYTRESERVDDYVARFEEWESRAQEFVNTYQMDLIQEHYEEFKAQALERFLQERTALMEDFKWLRFYSENAKQLQAVSTCVETLDFLDGKKREKAHWIDLLERSREVEELIPQIVERIENEVELAEHLVELAAQTSQESPSYRLFRELRSGIPQSCVDLSRELEPYMEKMRIADMIEEKIALVLEPTFQKKLPLAELESIVEDVRFSIINFEIVAKQVSSTVQVCRAFLSATKSMKKEPRSIKVAKSVYNSLPLHSKGFEMILEQLEQEEEVIEEVEALLSRQLGPSDFDSITFIENELAKVQFYEVSRTRINLFKIKVSILEKLSLTQEQTSLTIPFQLLKLLKIECTEALKKYDNDEELELQNIFLSEAEVEVNAYLMSLENIKTIGTFDKVIRTLMNFVDVSQELLDMQNKLRPNKSGAARLISFSTNNRLNGQVIPSILPVLANQAGKKLDTAMPLEVDRTPGPVAFGSRIGENTSIFELQHLRCNTLTSIRGELQKNAAVGETEAECINISHHVEHQLFLRSHYDGTYPVKATKLLKLLQSLFKLRRITLLVVSKNYNIDLLLFLMEQPLPVLQEMDTGKQKMLKVLKSSAQLMAAYDALMQSNKGEEIMSSWGQPRRKYGDGLAPLQQAALEKQKGVPTNHGDTDTSSKSDQKKPHDSIITEKAESPDDLLLQEQEKPETERLIPEQDDYKIGKLGGRKDPTPGKERVDSGGEGHDRERPRDIGEPVDEDPTRRRSKPDNSKPSHEVETQKIKLLPRKRGSESDDERNHKEGPRMPTPGAPLRYQPAWSIYKGIVNMEIKGEPSVDIDYSDLVCVDEVSKIRCFPKLPDQMKLRGVLDSPALESVVTKVLSKPSALADHIVLLGALETRCNMENFNRLVSKKGTGPRGEAIVFYCKIGSGTRLYLFPRRVLKPEWHTGFSVPSRRIYRSKAEYFWLLMQTNSETRAITDYVDPHPVYSPQMFTGEIPAEFMPPPVGENHDPEVRGIRANAPPGSVWAMGTGFDAHLPAASAVLVSASKYNFPGFPDQVQGTNSNRQQSSQQQGSKNPQSVIGGNMLLNVLKPLGDKSGGGAGGSRNDGPMSGSGMNQRPQHFDSHQNSMSQRGAIPASQGQPYQQNSRYAAQGQSHQTTAGMIQTQKPHLAAQSSGSAVNSQSQAFLSAPGAWKVPVPPPSDLSQGPSRKPGPQPPVALGRSEFSVYASKGGAPQQTGNSGSKVNNSQAANPGNQAAFLGKRPAVTTSRNPFGGQIHEVEVSDEGDDFFDQMEASKSSGANMKSGQKIPNGSRFVSAKKPNNGSGISSLIHGNQLHPGLNGAKRNGGF